MRGWNKKKCAMLFQSCPTLHDPMDCSLPDSSVHGVPNIGTSKYIKQLLTDIKGVINNIVSREL